MDKSTVEKYQKEDRPVWIMGIWTALPIEAKIVRLCEEDQAGIYAKIDYIPDKEYGNHAFRDVLLDDIYPSKEDIFKSMYDEMQRMKAEIRASIQTKDDCIRFLFHHPVSCTGIQTDGIERRVIREIAKERWSLDLE